MAFFECVRNWDGNPDLDWCLVFASRSDAVEAGEVIDNFSDWHANWDGNCRLYLYGLTVLGDDSGCLDLCSFLVARGYVEV